MGEAMQTLTESLRSVSLKYHAIVTNEQFDSRPWRANAHLLSPIVLELMQQAEIQICLCETEIAANNDKQVKTFDRRANLYSEWETGKSQQSELDVAIVGVTKEISCLSDEISAGERKIEALHEQIVQSKKDCDYWDTVFKATCWIPFANIGTGIKKSYEDGQFYIAVNVH
ncbi:MAG: hypothetical protein RSC36_08270, partial [Ruthenibacterium sp.]